MVKNHDLTIRVSREERERIRNIARSKGYPTVSAFIRDFALKNPITIEERIVEMHKVIMSAKDEINAAVSSLRQGNYNLGSVFYSMKPDYNAPMQAYRENPSYRPDPLKASGFEEDYRAVSQYYQ